MGNDIFTNCDGDDIFFMKLLKDVEIPLYSGYTKYNKLSGLIKFYNLNGRYGWSDP